MTKHAVNHNDIVIADDIDVSVLHTYFYAIKELSCNLYMTSTTRTSSGNKATAKEHANIILETAHSLNGLCVVGRAKAKSEREGRKRKRKYLSTVN